eukprot:1156532-Pelagomonas_calceolata.AAC.21
MKDTGGWHTGAAARTLRCLYETIMRVNLPMQVGRNQFPTQRYSLVRAVPLTGRHVHTQPSIKIFKPIRDRRQGRRRVSGPMEVSEEEPMQGSEETIYEDVYERNKEEQ